MLHTSIMQLIDNETNKDENIKTLTHNAASLNRPAPSTKCGTQS